MSRARHAVLPPSLRADCAACTGLCCVVPPFDAAQGFGFDKPAHTACTHLCDDFTCGIHANLVDRGFRGCTVFDCHGAGQRVSQQMFPGQDWRDSAETAQQMFSAYTTMRSLHDLMVLLYTASVHVDDTRLSAQLDSIERLCERMPVSALESAEAKRQTMTLLADPVIRSALQSLRKPD
jgi:hypothetical protein